jgi:hypothetical protein
MPVTSQYGTCLLMPNKVSRRNFWRHNVGDKQGENVRRDMSGGTKHPAGQNFRMDKASGRRNVRGDKKSGDRTSVGQNVRGTKHPWGQNVRRHNIHLGYILNAYSRQYLLKNFLSVKKRLGHYDSMMPGIFLDSTVKFFAND